MRNGPFPGVGLRARERARSVYGSLPVLLILGLVLLGGCANTQRLESRQVTRGPLIADRPAPPGGSSVGVRRATAAAGMEILFADDFSADRLGDFPRKLEFVGGSWEIVELRGRRYLRNHGPRHAAFRVPLQQVLPEAFVISFDLHMPHPNQTIAVFLVPEGHARADVTGSYFQLGPTRTGLRTGGQGPESLIRAPALGQVPTPVRIEVEGSHARVFVGSDQIANVPNAVIRRTNAILIQNTYSASAANPILLGSLRVLAAGGDAGPVVATPPPGNHPPSDPPAAQTISVCVVGNGKPPIAQDGDPGIEGELRVVTAAFHSASGDTVLDGRPFHEIHSAQRPPYAASQSWFLQETDIRARSRDYVIFGVPRDIPHGVLWMWDIYQGVPVFHEIHGASPPNVIYVPVRPGCSFQPYQLRPTIRPREDPDTPGGDA